MKFTDPQDELTTLRRLPAPPVDVVVRVMSSIRKREVTAGQSGRVLSLEAVAAFILAAAVLLPAVQSIVTLFDPMIALFTRFDMGIL